MACKFGEGLEVEHRAVQDFVEHSSVILFLTQCLSRQCAENSVRVWMYFLSVKHFRPWLRVTFVHLAYFSDSASFLSPMRWGWQPLQKVIVKWAIVGEGLSTVPCATEEHDKECLTLVLIIVVIIQPFLFFFHFFFLLSLPYDRQLVTRLLAREDTTKRMSLNKCAKGTWAILAWFIPCFNQLTKPEAKTIHHMV